MQLQLEPERIKNRVIVRKGNEHLNLLLNEIVFFYTENKVAYAVDKNGRKYMTDRNLSELEEKLDPSIFFRASRQYIINVDYIHSFKTYERAKIWVELKVRHPEHQIIVSQDTAPYFRKWIYES